jgi:threonine dehydrogenase-like Zn-dependent dehydrogenase
LHVPRDAQPRDFRAVLDFMARGTLDVGGLISDVRSPEVAADTYAALAEPDAELITVAFQWHA